MFEHAMYCSTCEDTRGFYRPWIAEAPAVEDEELACGVCGTALVVDPALYATAAPAVRSAA